MQPRQISFSWHEGLLKGLRWDATSLSTRRRLLQIAAAWNVVQCTLQRHWGVQGYWLGWFWFRWWRKEGDTSVWKGIYSTWLHVLYWCLQWFPKSCMKIYRNVDDWSVYFWLLGLVRRRFLLNWAIMAQKSTSSVSWWTNEMNHISRTPTE